MKKQKIILLVVFLCFFFLAVGIFVGRNLWNNYLFLPDEVRSAKSDDYGKVNLNYATKEQLKLLPGIGDYTADNILSYRSEHGLFADTEEILNVPGIGNETYASIRDYITVG